ncbi:MAG: hypothetical protein JWL89_325 [Candidatus Saccharibacteria bacterium]|jgi:hypothetical protein|nr:hypothetical protein [Candidatus Saccharibacteria bacterium]
MPPDEPNEEERLEELPEDGDTPFTPAGASRDDGSEPDDRRQVTASQMDDTRPDLDTDVELEEIYDQGQPEIGTNLGSSVANYDPEKDKRQKP